MGGTLDKPVTEKHNEQGTGNGMRYGIASMQGYGHRQENAHCAIIGVNQKLEDWSFFAVFDGKSVGFSSADASKISTHCAEHLLESIISTEESSNFADRIRSGFLNLDQSMRTVPEIDHETGTTAVGVFVTPEQIYFANCGDSRAMLCNSGGPRFITEYHEPKNKKELERIEQAGGYVFDDDNLVMDRLDVPRCLGVYETFKQDKNRDQCQQIVSPEPDVTVIARDEKDEFLVIACNGVWQRKRYDDDEIKENVCNFIRSRLLVTDDLVTIANELLDTCLQRSLQTRPVLPRRCENDMSAILITFPGAPIPSPEAIEKERNLERDIESLIIKLISIPRTIRKANRDSEGVNLPNLLYTLGSMEKYLPNLPPGGNIGTKRNFIENILQRCQDRGNMLKILVDEAVDVLLQKNGDDDRSLIELILEKQKESTSSRLPSSDNNAKMHSPNSTLVQADDTESKFQTKKRKRNNKSRRSNKSKDLCDTESPAKRNT